MSTYYRQQKTQQSCNDDAAKLQKLIDSKVPGLFDVQPNASGPRVECQGVGGIYCGWALVGGNAPSQKAWSHFYMEH